MSAKRALPDAPVGGEKAVCLLCKRKFANGDLLEKHEQFSDLHRDNLADKARRDAEAQKKKEAEEEAARVAEAAREAARKEAERQQEADMRHAQLHAHAHAHAHAQARARARAPGQIVDLSASSSLDENGPAVVFRKSGVVKWYNPRRRYGMLVGDDGEELFLPGKENTYLTAGDEVSFNPLTMEGKRCGVDVRSCGTERPRCILRAYETWDGHRDYNEDRHAFEELKGLGFFAGLYDGHGGSFSAEFLVKHLHKQIGRTFKDKWQMHKVSSRNEEVQIISTAIEDAFHKADASLIAHQKQNPSTGDGSTACVCVLVHGLEPVEDTAAYTGQTLFVANCGDCRCLLLRGKNSFRCSEDHKPNRKDEVLRIKKAGGLVGKDSTGIYRVGRKETIGGQTKTYKYLSTSRGFGDRDLKSPQPLVISTPEIKVVELSKRDWCVVLASDGVWDVMTDQEVAEICCENVLQPKTAATAVVRTAFAKGSGDNLSCMVMMFDWLAEGAVKDDPEGVNGLDKSQVDDMFAS